MLIKFFKSSLFLELIIVLFLIGISSFLRLSDLGYSHFYGDEVKTLYLDKTVSASNFLLNQRKGPGQFLVAWAVEKLTGDYDAYMVRLPFAITGILTVVVLYFLVKEFSKSRVAGLVAALLFSINGLYIAFGRTVQYQSLYVLLALSALYFAVKFLNSRWRLFWLFLSGVLMGLAFLCHYDSLFIFIPVVLYLTFFSGKINFLKNILMFLVPVLIISSFFYLPYFYKGEFYENTFGYLDKRVSGKEYAPSNSLYTAQVYNPLLAGFVILLFSFFAFSKGITKPLLVLGIWFLVPFFVFELIVKNPGTHIHNYYLPLFIFSAMGIQNILMFFQNQKIILISFSLLIIVLFIIHFSVNSQVYIPSLNSGYPFKASKVNLRFITFDLPKPNKSYHLYLYGFPYYRAWELVGNYLNNTEGVRGFYTNDNPDVAKFFLYKYPVTEPGVNFWPQYYILVNDSQEFNYPTDFPFELYTEVQSISGNGQDFAKIYKKQ